MDTLSIFNRAAREGRHSVDGAGALKLYFITLDGLTVEELLFLKKRKEKLWFWKGYATAKGGTGRYAKTGNMIWQIHRINFHEGWIEFFA